VLAFAGGLVVLPAVASVNGRGSGRNRLAPAFVEGIIPPLGETFPYTTATVAAFLSNPERMVAR